MLEFFIQSFTSLIAVLNPFGAVPVYLAMRPASVPGERHKVALTVMLTMIISLTLFMVFGQSILQFFSITMPAFRICGGILILLIAMAMLQGQMSPAKYTPEETEAVSESQSVAVVPLAIPILAGPGTFSTVILFSQQTESYAQEFSLWLSIVCSSLATYLVLLVAERLNRSLGTTGIKIITRIMGMILTAVAVQFFADGLVQMFPILAAGR